MSFQMESTDSAGRRYVSIFDDSVSSAPSRSYIYRPDGTLEYEYDGKVRRGTTDPEGLKPIDQ